MGVYIFYRQLFLFLGGNFLSDTSLKFYYHLKRNFHFFFFFSSAATTQKSCRCFFFYYTGAECCATGTFYYKLNLNSFFLNE